MELDLDSMALSEWKAFVARYPQLDDQIMFLTFKSGFTEGFGQGSKFALKEANNIVEKMKASA